MPAEFDITFFNSATDPQAYRFNSKDCIGLIKGDGLMNITNQYRLMEPGKQRDKFKKNFKAVCWSAAAFKDNKRSADNVVKHSGLICLDIDKLEFHDIEDLWNKITSDPYTYFAFISPSGNGIKVVIKIEPDVTKHLSFFQSLQEYYTERFRITIDQSGKDVSRLCFVCYDPTAFFNNSAAEYKIKKTESTPVKYEVTLSIKEQQNLRKNTAAD
ncbi:MAG: BT4734/BF3469 family protein, partial [Bacteroidota bacterium]|nr:BT4734/BF3469 family protein [Bacteroidota bacterium]